MKNTGGYIVVMVWMLCLAQHAHAYEFKLGQSSWKLGGSLRLDAYWNHRDLGDVGPGQAESLTPFILEAPTDTNINATFEYDHLAGYVEVGLTNALSTTDDSLDSLPEIRQLYLAYDFGSGHNILVGKVQSCFSEATPDQRLYNDNGMQGFGDLFSGRNIQIRYRYTHDKWLAQVALEQAKTEDPDEIMPVPDTIAHAYMADAYIPALVLALTYNGDMFHITPSAYFQTYTLKQNAESTTEDPLKDCTITTYGVCLNGDIKIDAFMLSGEAWWGQNLSIFDLDLRDRNTSTAFGQPVGENSNSIRDADSWGGWLQGAYQAQSGIARLGGGYQRAQTKLHGEYAEDALSTWGVFVNYQWLTHTRSFIESGEMRVQNTRKVDPDQCSPSGYRVAGCSYGMSKIN